MALVLIIGSIWISESKETVEKPSLDILGVLLSSLGLLGVVFGVIESTQYGWVQAKKVFEAFGQTFAFHGYSVSFVSIILGLIFLVGFFLWETRASKYTTPLVSLKLFLSRQFSSGMATTGVLAMAQAGMVFSIPVFLQAVRGQDAFHTGLAMLPLSATAFVIAPISGFLSHKYVSAKFLIQLGLFFNVIGYLVLRNVLTVDATITQLVPGMILLGAGIGLAIAQINNVTLSAVSTEQAGEASGVNNTFRQLGATLGTAIIGAVLLTAIASNLTAGIESSKIIPRSAKPIVQNEVAAQTSNVEFSGGAKIPGFIPKKLKDEIISISHSSITEAARAALAYAAAIAALGFGVSFFLPSGKNIEQGEELVTPAKAKTTA